MDTMSGSLLTDRPESWINLTANRPSRCGRRLPLLKHSQEILPLISACKGITKAQGYNTASKSLIHDLRPFNSIFSLSETHLISIVSIIVMLVKKMLQMTVSRLFATLKKPFLRVGLTWSVILMMVKGALPPTIAIAMYRSPAVATIYGNFGFLIALASILSLHLQPRARFQQNVAVATLLTCLAAAIALLSHFAGTQARKHTEISGPSGGSYNSSASVVNAIFLCVVVWLVSALRSAWPQVTIPFLISTIFSIVAISNGPELKSEHSSLKLCKQLLFCYLSGFGISTAIALLFLPKTSRSVFIDSSHQFVVQCRDLFWKQRDMLRPLSDSVDLAEVHNEEPMNQATVMKASVMGMLNSMSNLREELSYAKQEIAFGAYGSKDLESLLHRLESLMIPILGLSKIASFGIFSERANNQFDSFPKLLDATMLSFQVVSEQIDHALHLVGLLLQANGLFSKASTIPPGLDEKEHKHEDKLHIATEVMYNGLTSIFPVHHYDNGSKGDSDATDPGLLKMAEEHLYVLHLLQSSSVATDQLSQFARSLLVKSATQGWHLVLPRLTDVAPFSVFVNRREKYGTDSLDPEHLPPKNAVEKIGNMLRKALSTLGSDSSKFGFRVVAATMSIGIMAFLESTQHFFVEYRLVWAMVMIPISMSPTAGTAIYGFIGRALGVAAAMLLAYVNWYIVDGKPGGVIVMFFLSMMLYYFLLLKYPRFIVLFILAASNHVLIIGYELQLSVKVPKPVVSPQRYFPVYIFAPYRLLSVLAGLFVAFVLTIFPVQISEHKILRKNMGTSLALLTNYSSSVSSSLDQRIRGLEGDMTQESSPGRRLKARRNNILFKELALLSGMRQISTMVPWEISLGGRFPKSSYDQLIDAIQSAVASLSVIAYVSQDFPTFGRLPSNEFVRKEYLLSMLHPTSNEIVATLSLLALSLSAGNPLTPGVQAPSPIRRQRFLQEGVKELGPEVLNDPNFNAFLVVEVAGAQLLRSLATMVSTVRELVGTMDFGEERTPTTTQNTAIDLV